MSIIRRHLKDLKRPPQPSGLRWLPSPFFLLASCFLLLVFLSPAHADTMSGLVAWWKLDDGSGTSAADATGNGHTGTLHNISNPATATSGWTANGKRGGALIFDGNDDQVSIAVINSTTTFTIAAWIYQLPGGDLNAILLQNATAGMVTWDDGGGGLVIQWANADGSDTVSSTRMDFNQWYHVAAVSDGGVLTLYINGAFVGTGTVNASVPFDSVGGDTGGDVTKGILDDVRLYSRALSAGDIQQLFQGGAIIRNAVLRNGKMNN